MNDLITIAAFAALIALGFVAILLILGSLRKNRRHVFGGSEKEEVPGDMGKRLNEYEHTGILDFDEEEEPPEGEDPLGL